MKDINATVIVDISPDEEALFEGFKRSVRKGIRRAVKAGLKVEASDDWDSAYEVYRERCEKNKIKPNSLSDLKEWADKLFICKKGDKIIGVNMVWFSEIFDDKIPRVLASAILDEFSNDRPNDLLYWNMFKYYKKLGYEKFDLGGWQINPRENLVSVNRFKENFGEVVYFHRNYSMPRAVGRKLVRNVGLLWRLKRKLKGEKNYDDEKN